MRRNWRAPRVRFPRAARGDSGRRTGALPEDVGGRGGDPLEACRRFAVPSGAAADHVGEAVEGAVREGVEVDRAVGVAGVKRLFRAGGDVGIGELDQGHVRVGTHQLVGGVAVLAGVENRFAVHDRDEGLQLRAMPGRPDRRVAQNQQARVDSPATKPPRPRPTARPGVPVLRGIEESGTRPEPASRSRGRIAISIASGAAIISALACEYSPLPATRRCRAECSQQAPPARRSCAGAATRYRRAGSRPRRSASPARLAGHRRRR